LHGSQWPRSDSVQAQGKSHCNRTGFHGEEDSRRLQMLSQKDVSIVWPLTALGFVITSLAAKIFLKEQISSMRWAGICLIVLGACLVTWSGKQKDREPEEQSPASTDYGLR